MGLARAGKAEPACELVGGTSNLAAHRKTARPHTTIRRESDLSWKRRKFGPGWSMQARTYPGSSPSSIIPSLGNLAIQLLMQVGVPNDRLGVTPPEQIEGGQGMVLSIACPDEKSLARVEAICRMQGAKIHRQRA